MRKIPVFVSTYLCNSRISDTIEVEDDATEEEIDAQIKEWMFEQIEYGRSDE
jgi:hypothetical protein